MEFLPEPESESICCHEAVQPLGRSVVFPCFATGAKPTYLRRLKELEKVKKLHSKGYTVIANLAQNPDKRPVVSRELRTLLKTSFMFIIRPASPGTDQEPSSSNAAPPPLSVPGGAENRWMLGQDDCCS